MLEFVESVKMYFYFIQCLCVLYPPPLICTIDMNEQDMLPMALKHTILMQPFHRWD